MIRTHTCGDLRKDDCSNFVVLQGWVNTRRDHGGIIFIDLRDRYGLTQVVFYPDKADGFKHAEQLRREDVIEIHGEVVARKEGMQNPNIPTGEIEVSCSELKVLNKSEVPPLEVDDRIIASDDMRLRFRYIDLRRPIMQRNLMTRHRAAMGARKWLTSQNFMEIETPLLVRSTPEGARDYVVPSRMCPGRFYALPQSPQLYKQILMVSSMDRYFQLSRALRDEDLRQDRQPEHTQIDLEMSFPTLEDLYAVGEGVMKACFKEGIDYEVETPFPRFGFAEAMDKYGIDKPDIRFELFLTDVSDIVSESNFEVFKNVVKDGGIVKCINPEKDISRSDLDNYIDFCQKNGAKGMAWMRVTEKGLDGSIVKFFDESLQKKLIEKVGAKPGSVIMFIADSYHITNQVLAKLRNKLGEDLKLYDPATFKFCWITDFPLFEWNEDKEMWDPCHHLFCMPSPETMEYLDTDPGKVYCTQYDMVLNGVELASGSIRIHRSDIQERVMKVIGLTPEEVENKFGFLLEAFKYGAPPHGGMGIGFDRVCALMLGYTDIREVIAFPKNKSAECPMDGSPNIISEEQMKELAIRTTVVEKKKD